MKLLLTLLLLTTLTAKAAAPVIWQSAQYAQFLSSLGFLLNDGKSFQSLSADPTSGGGLAASIGSLGLFNNSGVGQLYLKIGAGNTAWQLVQFLSFTSPLVNTAGTVSCNVASGVQAGCLSSADWTTFNSKQPAGNYITDLTSDVSASGPGSVVATVNSVGGSSAANIHSAELAANAATSANTVSTIVKRDGSGNFSAGTISASLTGHASLDLALTGGTMSGVIDMGSNKVTSVSDPTAAQDAATKNYVDSVASGLNPKQAAYAGSTANIVGTYLNGVACVGATFTVTATGAFSIDGVTPPAGSRILFKDQTSGFQNGVYDLTVAGSIGVSPILTRSLDYNNSTDMNAGDLIPVINGTVNNTTSWLQTSTIATCGSDSLTFTEWSYNPAAFLLKANNLSDVASTLTSFNNLSGMTLLGDIIYGGASGTRTVLPGNITTTKKFLAQTGSGAVSAAPSWLQPACGDLSNAAASCSTDATNASNISSGTLAVARGGTGANTLTANDVILGNGTSAVQFVAPGTSGNVLTSNGTTWTSAAAAASGSSIVRMTLSGGVTPWTTIDGYHRVTSTVTLTTVDLSMGNCSSTGTVVIGIIKNGTSATTATLTSSSGSTCSTRVTGLSVSLVSGDVVSVDINSADATGDDFSAELEGI